MASGRKDLGDTGRRGGPTGGRDKVRGLLRWSPEGKGGAVGGPAPLLEVISRETGYKGMFQNQSSWWSKRTIKETLWNIL